ncbi:uncharacterized protein LOC107417297 [Ziziphus jujuba]|uniref:Uncharacterized protein LOC107417297 n=1 Tax=Ziziphus jujuba TaxID=326968 RepID=A0ABM3IHM0_ZIZJJ|nr:uncharacterized protein LOC107417297 [Ziziphus jujuba]
MILVHIHPLYPSKLRSEFCKPQNSFLSSTTLFCSSGFSFKLSSNASFRCFCSKNQNTHEASSQSFSALAADSPWDRGSVWSTMAFYMFCLHIPLSFGGMSVVSQILQEPNLDPQTEAISLLVAQILELIGTLLLLKFTVKPQYNFMNFFKATDLSKDRNWLLASAIGFGFLFSLVSIASFLADKAFEPKAVNNPVVKEILVSGNISMATFVLVCCFITPVLEEIVYRGFLLASISTTMKWPHAILASSTVFAAAHLSGENFIQLFIIGCVLGCSYCWTGNLRSSVLIHSLYNVMTLLIMYLS